MKEKQAKQFKQKKFSYCDQVKAHFIAVFKAPPFTDI